ncbi:adenosylcobalamin-dependent ribonucleoside-diphosphate reductase, partial [Candidatus Woesearchaeota archaeon]|nr:adenosylcobalamin-dependent ribonucleoside-diphosphate reductase [Candidatus Woesearchaeota archaeon]
SAIQKALLAAGNKDKNLANVLAKEVVKIISRKKRAEISVEQIQDFVEQVLIQHNLPDVAKSYILYRQKRAELRKAKQLFGVSDELKLSVNAVKVLTARYLLKDENGKIVETPVQLFKRVAKAISEVDLKWEKKEDVKKIEEQFYKLMIARDFLPNTPTLMNAGTKIGQLSACFVIPVEDSLVSIFDAVKSMALIHQSGGGTGFSFSKLRPKGDIVKSTKGIASGPVSFIRVFDTTTDVIKQGGKRRGANMAILHYSHPDIVEFITSKTKENFLSNFNISVSVDDKFMYAVYNNKDIALVNPRTAKTVSRKNAKDIFELIATMAWRTGDPGMIFIDKINKANPTPELGNMESTNPCGEQPLLPYESCNLGSINLANMVSENEISWVKLKRTIHLAVRFLDNVIDANKYVLPEIKDMTKNKNRKIGLGVMGFAEMLLKLMIPYNSEQALDVADKLMKFIQKEAKKASSELAKKKGNFPEFKKSGLKSEYENMRNATVTTIAPTGTISIIADATSGIEPLFGIAFVRNVLEGTRLVEVNKEFEAVAKQKGFYNEELVRKITKTGSVQEIKEVPDNIKKIFVTALDISPEWHVRMQAVFQKHVDNAVSKTVNLPHDATVQDVKNAYLLAHKLGCKGVTVYRYGSKKEQVLYSGAALTNDINEEPIVSAHAEFAGGCPTGFCTF